MILSDKRKKFHAECLEQATTPDEDMLIKTIFCFIEKQDKEFIQKLKEEISRIEKLEWSSIICIIDALAGAELIDSPRKNNVVVGLRNDTEDKEPSARNGGSGSKDYFKRGYGQNRYSALRNDDKESSSSGGSDDNPQMISELEGGKTTWEQ